MKVPFEANDWPMERHDPQMTGHSTIITCDTDKDNFYEFFIASDNSLKAVDFRSLEPKFTIISPSENSPKAIASKSNQVLVELPAESGTVSIVNARAELKSHYQSKAFRSTPVVADIDGDGSNEIIVEDASGFINAINPLSEKETVRWKVEGLPYSGGGHFSSGDIDSDGRDEFLYSLGSNEIIALDNDAADHILWRTKLDGSPDTPILADVDGDGLCEIIVCTGDGYLNVLK